MPDGVKVSPDAQGKGIGSEMIREAIRHKMLQFIPEMGWIATFLCLCSIKLAKHLIKEK